MEKINEGYWVVRQKGHFDETELQIAYVGYPFHSEDARIVRFSCDGGVSVDKYGLIEYLCPREGIRVLLDKLKGSSNG